VNAIRYLSAEIANVYITTGELILDIALLRSIDDFVDDEMSRQAMDRINRDESRHVAVDFHMVEYYASEAWIQAEASRPARPLRERLKAYWAFGRVLGTARPFFREVFFAPMEVVDPTGRRIREAFKRVQLLSTKPEVAARPFVRFILTCKAVYNHPITGPVFGRFAVRILGLDPEVMVTLYSDEEARRARDMSYDDLAAEALAAKHDGLAYAR
jgi:hypothetical protein